MSIRIALFGQPRVVSADGSREYPLARKTLNVLAYLILNRARPPARDSLAFALFPDDDEEKARTSLRRNLSHLLASLPDGKQFVNADNERVAWNNDAPAHVDVIAFERAVREGRDADALAEYAGQLLPTLYDEWTTADRERLRDEFHKVLVRTIAQERSQRRFDAATATAHRLLDEDPWREDVVRQLMSIRYEAGDRAGALAVFERFAARLREEMQAEPMSETIAVRDAVLRGARLATSEPRRSADVAVTAPADFGLPFVGRNAAMERARDCWHLAADGRAGVLFVSGEAGVGKSRFTTEFVRIAEREGGLIVRGYTSAGGERQPYEAFFEALHGMPERFDAHAGATLTDDRAARLRLFESIRRRLSELSHARPVVIVLEDLHWAGASTIELLDFVARHLDRAPVLIVATTRSDELARAHPLRALRRQLVASGFASDIALERLTPEDATRAARAVLPASVDEHALARAIAWVDGVPLLLVEAVRDLAAGRVSSASSMTALVAERFVDLSSAAETTLIFGAVLGDRFDLGTLVAATAWRDDQILDAIGESIECGFVRATSGAPGLAFEFTHDLVRVAAMERIPAPDLTRAHGLVARAICAQAPADPTRAGQIARHFAAAGEPLRAAEYFRAASRYALDVYANEDARESATSGLALCNDGVPAHRELAYDMIDLREQSLARIGATKERREDARRLVALAADDEHAALALDRLFEACRADAAERSSALARLACIAGTSNRAARTYLYACARHAFLEGDHAQARASALQAADAFDLAGEVRPAMKARFLAVVSLYRLGAFAEGQAELEKLRPVLDASDDLALRAEFHLVASATSIETHWEEALADARRSLEFSLKIGDRWGEARARQNIAIVASKQRRYDDGLREHELALAAYRDVGDVPAVRDTLLNIVGVRTFCGDYGPITERLLDEVRDDAAPWLAQRLAFFRGALAMHARRPDLAEQFAIRARESAKAIRAVYFETRAVLLLAAVLASEGRLTEAATHMNAAIDAIDVMREADVEAEGHAFAARLLATIGDLTAARKHARKAAESNARKRLDSCSEVTWNIAATYALLGDREAAEQLARDAAAAAIEDALCMPAALAETYMQLPWHQEAIAYLWGRPVPLRLDESRSTR